MKLVRASVIALAAIAAASPAQAQGYFGKNQVQYDRFHWRVLETEHFLVHYYPEEREASVDAARIAERAYARLSRILDHQFREKKPIILFSSRADFGQNNVTGDLGEGTGGVTEFARHRMLLPFTGDYKSFEHVLTHEMVHEFQYDIFARGRAGSGFQTFAQIDPPLWFIEGMAEYLSIGPDHPQTRAWVRDAALNGNLPTIEQMTREPERFFPYRYGEALWSYVGQRWGDEVIGQILQALPNAGVQRAFRRYVGLSLDDLNDEWREAMQDEHLPQVASLQRARKFAQPLLTARKSGGEVFLAPALSNDGKYIAFLSNGNFFRGEVFIDLWLGDARTGKRIKRLVKSTTDPNFEELRMIYSQSSFSPDGGRLAFTAQRNGRDVLYLLDVRRRRILRRFDLPLEGVTSPTWSPDARQLAFSGSSGGITDLYIVDADGRNLRRLTDDKFGDLQPSWSPDGKTIAFATERGPGVDFSRLRLSKWSIAFFDLASRQITIPENQAGLNTNPVWAPDGKSIAYVSDRTGIANVFLYDRDAREHYQLTNVVGAVNAISEYSPAITWARGADRLAFTYFENGDYTIWSVDNPRMLRKAPFREAPKPNAPVVAAGARDTAPHPSAAQIALAVVNSRADTGVQQKSFYRSSSQTVRLSDEPPAVPEKPDSGVVTVAAMLDSADLALPDTTKFKDVPYHVGYQADYVAQPAIGYQNGGYNTGLVGGTTIVLSDLIGNNQLAFSGQVNGRFSDAIVFASYTNLGHRLAYTTGGYQEPYYYPSADFIDTTGFGQTGTVRQTQVVSRLILRQAFLAGLYPLNRFTRFEVGARFNQVDQTNISIGRDLLIDNGFVVGAGPFFLADQKNLPGRSFLQPFVAYVSDNALFGYTGPISGRRMRFSVTPTVGSYRWMEYLGDYRRYDPIIFTFLTVATRLFADVNVGRDEAIFPNYVGRPDFVRGYDRESPFSQNCTQGGPFVSTCSATQLLGSRVAVFNAELRFPVIRRFELGVIPIALPPVDGLIFYDAGMGWYSGQQVSLKRPENFDPSRQRYPLRSYGAGIRFNAFNFALLRFDYAIPVDQPHDPGKRPKGVWVFSIGPSF